VFKGEKRIFGFRGRGFQVGGAERHTVRPGKVMGMQSGTPEVPIEIALTESPTQFP